MKTTQIKPLPYGHPSTLRDVPGGHPCKGWPASQDGYARHELTPIQKEWLRMSKIREYYS